MMQGTIHSLYYYPVKGLSPQPLNQVELQAGQGFPLDRLFGFARHDGGFDPAHPQPLPKSRFLMLMRDERLAELRSHFDGPSARSRRNGIASWVSAATIVATKATATRPR